MAPGGHGGARDGAGAKKRVVEVQGDNPFSIAREFQERKKQRQLANQKEEEFERRKKVLEEPGWKCGVCTLDNNSDEAKLAGVCAVCGAERAQEDSEVTTTEENAGHGENNLGEQTVLSLAQMFVGVVKKAFNGLLDFLKTGVESQLDRFRKEFKKAEESTKATIAEAGRIAAAVEETRRRVEGRDKLKDLTYCEEWIASAPNGNSWCRICSANYVEAGITDQRSLKSPWLLLRKTGACSSISTPVNFLPCRLKR